jgi:hypothetical protein
MIKKINRKKIIETLEFARQGFASIIMDAKIRKDLVLELSSQAHHSLLDKAIVELGGESVLTKEKS